MPKLVSFGGQMRNIQCTCGWKVRKSIREANATYERHLRYCPDTSKEEVKEKMATIPKKADKVQTDINGWKGLNGTAVSTHLVHNITIENQTYLINAPIAMSRLGAEPRQVIMTYLIKKGTFALTNSYTIKDDDALTQLFLKAMSDLSGKDIEIVFV